MSRATFCLLLGIAISFPASSATLTHAYDFQGNVDDLAGSRTAPCSAAPPPAGAC